jgi:hypothetical protein
MRLQLLRAGCGHFLANLCMIDYRNFEIAFSKSALLHCFSFKNTLFVKV